MLKIENIKKTYKTGDLIQTALNGVSLNLRDNEFVAILGPSGSGKTTLLNIIGGLDRYDSGDLIINNISTKKYKDRDWDSYRNHTIGFVFQSYNLIPHQTVLANVELALTIAGISKKERKQRSLKALEEVGLKEQAHKKPNQMSGGQMQRVAIARALVNNPDILLADEPTGALDSKTSIQVMELLKKVAKDRLVVMVTHNPELAEIYANRIVKLQDGQIIADSNPYNPQIEVKEPEHKKMGKAKMGFFTALGLSFNNLLTKKGRTFLTAFAGSIGIIGIALILSLSTGFQNYIDKIQEDTMTSYPLTINSETTDLFSAILSIRADGSNTQANETLKEQRYISSMVNAIGSNDLTSFKKYLEENEELYKDDVNRIKYSYSVSPLIYGYDVTGKIVQLNPSTALSSIYSGAMTSAISMMSTSSGVFNEGTINKDKYEVLKGRYPENELEVAIILPDKDKISDLLLYSLGFKDNSELKSLITSVMSGDKAEVKGDPIVITYDDLLNLDLRLINPSDTYKFNEKYSTYENMSSDQEYMKDVFNNSEQLKVVGLLWSDDSNNSGVIFSPDLVQHIINKSSSSYLVRKQLSNKEVDVFSNKRFDDNSDNKSLDFNDMISIDQDALKDAFKINLDTDSLGNMSDPEESMKLIEPYAKTAVVSVQAMTVPMTQTVTSSIKTLATPLVNEYASSDLFKVYKPNSCDEYINNLNPFLGCKLPSDALEEDYFVVSELVTALNQISVIPQVDQIISGLEGMGQTNISVTDFKTYLSQAGLGQYADMLVDVMLGSLKHSDLPAGYAKVGDVVYMSESGYTTYLSNAGVDAYKANALSDQVLDPIVSQTNVALKNMVKQMLSATLGEMANSLSYSSIELDPSLVKKVCRDSFDEYINNIPFDSNGLIDINDLDSNLANNSINNVLIENETAILNNGFEMAKEISQLTVTMQIGLASSEMLKPLTDAFTKEDGLMSVDTEAFAKAFNFDMDEDEVSRLMGSLLKSDSASYKSNLINLGYQDVDDPTSISIYFKDFDSKSNFISILENYNDNAEEEKVIKYTDITGLLMSSVETIINSVTYVLIAFVSISLIVSSIMIAVITLISVMERTKEIGILRAMGASKKNVSSIFNAETFIIGLLSGAIGVGFSLSVIPIINTVIHNVTGNYDINAVLPVNAAITLVIISVVLTLVAGLIPSRKAAKQDPVIALRSE